ncbi:hypothetical protein [Chamaesiphon sp. VAR_48_metabat_135_sub]|nr:hypothetical protein [Chamaesiphon sp. VAR_48_metabat_135_sub]
MGIADDPVDRQTGYAVVSNAAELFIAATPAFKIKARSTREIIQSK